MKNNLNGRKLGISFIGALFLFSPLALSSIDLEEAVSEDTEFFLEQYEDKD